MRELSQTLIRQAKYDAAEQQLQASLEIEPDYWLNYRELGRIRFMQGKYDEAAESYRMESELVADKSQALNNLGAAYFLGERFDDAIGAWEGISNLAQNGRILSNLGSAYFFRRDFAHAAEMFRRAIDTAPENHEYWSGLGEAQLYAGTEDARPTFKPRLNLRSVASQSIPTIRCCFPQSQPTRQRLATRRRCWIRSPDWKPSVSTTST